jgi:hypothetical protein
MQNKQITSKMVLNILPHYEKKRAARSFCALLGNNPRIPSREQIRQVSFARFMDFLLSRGAYLLVERWFAHGAKHAERSRETFLVR